MSTNLYYRHMKIFTTRYHYQAKEMSTKWYYRPKEMSTKWYYRHRKMSTNWYYPAKKMYTKWHYRSRIMSTKLHCRPRIMSTNIITGLGNCSNHQGHRNNYKALEAEMALDDQKMKTKTQRQTHHDTLHRSIPLHIVTASQCTACHQDATFYRESLYENNDFKTCSLPLLGRS